MMQTRTLRAVAMRRALRGAMLALVVVAGIVAAVASEAGRTVHFTLGYSEGFEQKYKVKYSQEIDGGFFTFARFADVKITDRCVGADTSGLKMKTSFDEVEMSRRVMERLQEDPAGAQLTGKSVSYRVTPDYDVEDIQVEGYVENWAQIQDLAQIVLDSGFPWLPDREYSKGDSWDLPEREEKENGRVKRTTATFKFKEMKKEKGRECAKVEGEIQVHMEGSFQSPQGSVEGVGEGKGKLEFLFDPERRVFVKLKSKFEMEIRSRDTDDLIASVAYSVEREAQ